MKLLEFIKNNIDWEEKLTSSPYCLKIVRDSGYILFKYDQIKSDFNLDIVREARGIILREKDFKVVCFPFVKFFNVDETYADKINWNQIKIQEKIDGSLMKLWYDNDSWHISTNGNIDAYKSPIVNVSDRFKSFGDLFEFTTKYIDFNKLDTDYTYMFELVSPYTKVVVEYPDIDIYHIGTRNNITYKEVNVDIGVKKPKEYLMKTENEIKEAAINLPFDKEGYVVVDNYYNRVKIKSPKYVEAHRMVTNHYVSATHILDIIRKNEQSEFLSYYPEYEQSFSDIENKYKKLQIEFKNHEKIIKPKLSKMNKKDFAVLVMSKYKDFYDMDFKLYDNKIENWEEYLNSLSTDKLLERIKLKGGV